MYLVSGDHLWWNLNRLDALLFMNIVWLGIIRRRFKIVILEWWERCAAHTITHIYLKTIAVFSSLWAPVTLVSSCNSTLETIETLSLSSAPISSDEKKKQIQLIRGFCLLIKHKVFTSFPAFNIHYLLGLSINTTRALLPHLRWPFDLGNGDCDSISATLGHCIVVPPLTESIGSAAIAP